MARQRLLLSECLIKKHLVHTSWICHCSYYCWGRYQRKIRQILSGHVPIRISGVIIFILACLVIIYQIFSITISLLNNSEVNQHMVTQWIDDLFFCFTSCYYPWYLYDAAEIFRIFDWNQFTSIVKYLMYRTCTRNNY